MNTLTARPAALSPWVDVIWVSEASGFSFSNRLLPMLHHEWMFSLSDVFDVRREETPLPATGGAWLAGQQTRLLLTRAEGRHYTVGVLFRPWGLSAFSRLDISELQNQFIDPALVFGQDVAALTEQLSEKPSPERVLKLVEKYLLGKLVRPELPPFIRDSLSRIAATPLSESLMSRLAARYGMTPQALIRRFRQLVGCTPAQYQHLVLFQRTLRRLATDSGESLTGTGYDLGFFDQAHFVRFFRKYTGLTPSAYRKEVLAGNVFAHHPNLVTTDVPGWGGVSFHTIFGETETAFLLKIL